jgi:O-methyltransferase
MLRKILRSPLASIGYELKRIRSRPANERNIPDGELYRPLFSPWLGKGEFAKYYALAAPKTLVSPDRCYVLWILLRQALNLNGDIWECGVYKGGTAAMMAAILRDSAQPDKKLFLFDTFQGMPETDAEKDLHQKGDFHDTSAEAVSNYVGADEFCVVRQGLIPDTFEGLESASIAFAHVDLDIYKSILDCLNFIWPRLTLGGFIVFDDYGFPTCPGARTAVDEFFATRACVPLCLPTGQAVVFKGIA